MSGHSKWHSIKHKKAAVDARRGKVFTRLIKEIMVAARSGGGDPDANARLRTAVQAAKAASMPMDNIKRAIQRGTGDLEGGSLDEIRFEGYGPGGAALIVDTVTDNRNRTVSEVRHMFSKWGGNLGETGSVGWMFNLKSQVFVSKEAATDVQLLELLLEAGAEDIADSEETWEILSPPEAHDQVIATLEAAGIPTEESEVAQVPQNLVKLEGKDASTMLRLYDTLEEHDDVQKVYSNFEIEESELEAMAT